MASVTKATPPLPGENRVRQRDFERVGGLFFALDTASRILVWALVLWLLIGWAADVAQESQQEGKALPVIVASAIDAGVWLRQHWVVLPLLAAIALVDIALLYWFYVVKRTVLALLYSGIAFIPVLVVFCWLALAWYTLP